MSPGLVLVNPVQLDTATEGCCGSLCQPVRVDIAASPTPEGKTPVTFTRTVTILGTWYACSYVIPEGETVTLTRFAGGCADGGCTLYLIYNQPNGSITKEISTRIYANGTTLEHRINFTTPRPGTNGDRFRIRFDTQGGDHLREIMGRFDGFY